jgi:THO complex subunit 2
LLREENEGYGKLSHEFNLALAELPKAGLMDTSEISSRSGELLTVVNALIGYFELDPNRVLDNILDICSQNLLSHARFMMHFLHHSPWAPTTLATSAPFAQVSEAEKRRRLNSIQIDFVKHYRTDICREGGSALAAELLGFKLRYCSSASSQKSSAAPESLIFLIALLIKSGFIKLSDIYPYVCIYGSTADCYS